MIVKVQYVKMKSHTIKLYTSYLTIASNVLVQLNDSLGE